MDDAHVCAVSLADALLATSSSSLAAVHMVIPTNRKPCSTNKVVDSDEIFHSVLVIKGEVSDAPQMSLGGDGGLIFEGKLPVSSMRVNHKYTPD